MKCDVLVVGGAIAGLTTAIEARLAGAEVVVACKGKAGRSGNTVVSGSQLAAVVPYPSSPDSPDQHFQDSMSGGKEICDDTLLRIFVDHAGHAVLRAEERGVRLVRSEGELLRRTPPGHTHPRGLIVDNAMYPVANGGLGITVPLHVTAQRLGIRFLDETPVIRLLVADGTVRGAVGIDTASGNPVVIQSGAVVVAAGGAGRVFANTNNIRGISGDSYALMLEAGATLRDMEFVQFYPSQLNHPFKVVVASPLFNDGAVLRNRHGERFMPHYDPVNEDRATRDIMSQAIFYELQKGNGVDGEVYMDCTSVPEDALQKKYFGLIRDLRKQGVDPAHEWLRISPTTHFIMGGAVVDARGWTGVPGLFAAGEAIGGVHGANRLAGNALSETLVTGEIAGAAAAEVALKQTSLPEPGPIDLPVAPANGRDLEDVRKEIRRAVWDGASIVRSEKSLASALESIRECRAEVDRCAGDAAGLAETRLMCLAAEAIILPALARKESRGAHFREDFPKMSPEWLGTNTVRLTGGQLEVKFVPRK